MSLLQINFDFVYLLTLVFLASGNCLLKNLHLSARLRSFPGCCVFAEWAKSSAHRPVTVIVRYWYLICFVNKRDSEIKVNPISKHFCNAVDEINKINGFTLYNKN